MPWKFAVDYFHSVRSVLEANFSHRRHQFPQIQRYFHNGIKHVQVQHVCLEYDRIVLCVPSVSRAFV